ncbi:hypothetical protein [Rubrivivax rivuli]|uniref:Uncharacterized protein n=1 Tax=Rubrivivax rivuli TaxID=1862385 RepID=A0A437RSG8_9BURK|nr:hypothetical protein [Rubrivivax rivuli]RVU49703.1 hypothetical protein EOE66_03875 [Rubrivivax rivuli]
MNGLLISMTRSWRWWGGAASRQLAAARERTLGRVFGDKGLKLKALSWAVLAQGRKPPLALGASLINELLGHLQPQPARVQADTLGRGPVFKAGRRHSGEFK